MAVRLRAPLAVPNVPRTTAPTGPPVVLPLTAPGIPVDTAPDRLLVLGKTDFDHFMASNPEAKAVIDWVARARQSMNEEDRIG